MTPPQQVVYRQRDSPMITQKAQLIYKLFLLENARNTLEQQLLNLTNKAYEEVQGFLNTSFVFKKPCVFSDLAKALDAKCQAVDKLSALLKDLTAEPLVNVKSEVITHQLKPLRDKGILMTDVLKFGPMLKNSIAKAVQVLGAAVSLQVSQRAATVQQDDMMCGISSSYNSAVATASPSPRWKAEVKEHAVFEESRPPDAGILPPAIIQSPEINTPERPPKLLTPIQAVLPEISNPKPMKTTPLISWGCENDVQVQHQKQTSSQLLHFLRAKAKNTGALEVTVMEWSKSTSSSPQSMSPAIKTQSYQLRRVKGDLMDAVAPKTLHADIENQTPIFRVKRLESNGSLTYTCVIATKTELWDIGDIFTEAGREDSGAGVLENNSRNVAAEVENSSANIQWKTQNVRRAEPERQSNFKGETTAEISGITVPEFQIRRFEEAEVVVSHSVSPGDFYVQHADCTVKLQALVTDSWKATRSYAEQNRIPDIGTQVMGWFPRQEQWCRAQVTKICGVSGDNNATDGGETSIKVEVRRLDYGDFACLSLQKMKEMTPEMAALPLQAVQVSLANVTPATGRDWSEEAVGWFQAMVHNRTLYARLYPQGPKVTVELFLEKGKLGAMRRGASLSLRLAQNGHAKHNKLKNGSLVKKSTFQLQMKKQDSEWEKYLISYYTQSKK